jgi:hypothetical protein
MPPTPSHAPRGGGATARAPARPAAPPPRRRAAAAPPPPRRGRAPALRVAAIMGVDTFLPALGLRPEDAVLTSAALAAGGVIFNLYSGVALEQRRAALALALERERARQVRRASCSRPSGARHVRFNLTPPSLPPSSPGNAPRAPGRRRALPRAAPRVGDRPRAAALPPRRRRGARAGDRRRRLVPLPLVHARPVAGPDRGRAARGAARAAVPLDGRPAGRRLAVHARGRHALCPLRGAGAAPGVARRGHGAGRCGAAAPGPAPPPLARGAHRRGGGGRGGLVRF